jgi:hypothetical protein
MTDQPKAGGVEPAQHSARSPDDAAGRHPPKPRLALSVGIVGHRPNRLPADAEALVKLEREVADVLEMVAAAVRKAQALHGGGNGRDAIFSSEPPVLAIVSALAEGADRMAVRAAFAKGYQLDAPLPFAADEYEKDFLPRKPTPEQPIDPVAEAKRSADSIAEFRSMIGEQARAVLELPGTRKSAQDPDDPDAKKAYETLGLTVLGQSDILLTIWDGGESHGRGGTTEMLNAAARVGMPIIHIDAKGKEPARIRWTGFSPHPFQVNMIDDLPVQVLDSETVQFLVDELVRPPADQTEVAALRAFYRERFRARNRWVWFPLLMSLFRVRPMQPRDRRPSSIEERASGLAKFARSSSGPRRASQPTAIVRAFAWSDAVGTRFGQVFRSAIVINFFLAAAAAVVVAYSLVAHDVAKPEVLDHLAEHKSPFLVIEIMLVFGVLAHTFVGRRLGWHRRWIEGREVAERLRVALPLWVLGARPAMFLGPEPTWTGWYARAVIRTQGMRAAVFNAATLAAAGETLVDVINDQREYHATSAARMEKLAHRLERAGEFCVAVTVLAAVAFLIAVAIHYTPAVRHAYGVTAIAVALPALATAFYGIRMIGDFEGMAKRSHRTDVALSRLIEALASDWPAAVRPAEPPSFALLRARARSIADAMLGDTEKWRLAAESRELAVPG